VIISVLAELNTIVTDQCATLIVTLLRNFNRKVYTRSRGRGRFTLSHRHFKCPKLKRYLNQQKKKSSGSRGGGGGGSDLNKKSTGSANAVVEDSDMDSNRVFAVKINDTERRRQK
jgi:hypothetical protein